VAEDGDQWLISENRQGQVVEYSLLDWGYTAAQLMAHWWKW
jgi:hypothetical protein